MNHIRPPRLTQLVRNQHYWALKNVLWIFECREGWMNVQIIDRWIQPVTKEPFCPTHDSTGIICSSDCVDYPSWIDHQQPGARLVRSSLVDMMECRGGVSLQCQCTLRLRPWNKTQSNLHKLKGTLCSRIQSYKRASRVQRTTSWTGRIHSLTTKLVHYYGYADFIWLSQNWF